MNNVSILPSSFKQSLTWLNVRKFNLVKFVWLFWALGAVLIISFLVFYIYQVNAETSERYSINDYQKRIKELSMENQILEINSAQMSSLDNVTNLLEELSFEKTDKIHYIQVLETEVVTK